MEIVLLAFGITLLWVASGLIEHGIRGKKWHEHKRGLVGRVVRLDESFCKSNGITRYGEIIRIAKEKQRKILEVELRCYQTYDDIKKARATYDKAYALAMKEYARQLDEFNKRVERMGGQHYQRLLAKALYMQIKGYNVDSYAQLVPPCKPEYDFTSTSGDIKNLVIKKRLTKLMPRNFDPINEIFIKNLDTKEVKRKKHMPRIFKLSAFAAGSVLIWDFVVHANDITIFLVHAFTGK